jgi:hypothetical protein
MAIVDEALASRPLAICVSYDERALTNCARAPGLAAVSLPAAPLQPRRDQRSLTFWMHVASALRLQRDQAIQAPDTLLVRPNCGG